MTHRTAEPVNGILTSIPFLAAALLIAACGPAPVEREFCVTRDGHEYRFVAEGFYVDSPCLLFFVSADFSGRIVGTICGDDLVAGECESATNPSGDAR